MKLEFILADTTWQSMKAALSSLSLQAKNNAFENYLVLVPETKTLEAEQLLLSNADAFMNVSINSFDRLLEKMESGNYRGVNLIEYNSLYADSARDNYVENVGSDEAFKLTSYKHNRSGLLTAIRTANNALCPKGIQAVYVRE